MSLLAQLRQLHAHASWADTRLLDALRAGADAAPEALREFAHLLGADEVWLARLERRPARAAVWPEPSLAGVETLLAETSAGYGRYLDRLEEELAAPVEYVNSAGQRFSNTVGEILMHVALHGQYHRGKTNLLLRQAGAEPAPADYIAFVRGVAAATRGANRAS